MAARCATQPAFPFWGRGKQSIVLDLHDADDLRVARDLARGADVVIETFRPGVVERLGLGYDDLAPDNPGLVYASVTAFGRTGPLAGVKGYEGLVMARLGGHDAMGVIVDRPGPAFCARAVRRVERRADRAARHPRRALRARAQRPRATRRHDAGAGLRRPRHLERDHPPHRPPVPGGVHRRRRWPTRAPSVPNNPLFFRLAGRAVGRRPLDAVLADHAAAVLARSCASLELDWMFDDPKWSTRPRLRRRRPALEYFELHAGRGPRRRPPPSGRRCSTASPTCGPRSSATAASCSTTRRCCTTDRSSTVDDPALGAVRQPGPMVQHVARRPAAVDRSAPDARRSTARRRARRAVRPHRDLCTVSALEAGRRRAAARRRHRASSWARTTPRPTARRCSPTSARASSRSSSSTATRSATSSRSPRSAR